MNDEDKLVSVCIPNYNGSKYIRDAIESALIQINSDIEIVVCDDQSDDNSWGIISSYKDNRIKAFKNERNLGMVGNFREVLGKASGNYIIFLNYDDILCPDSLKKMRGILDDNPECSFVFGNVKYIGDRSGQTHFNFSRILEPNEWINSSIKDGGNKTYQCGTLFRRPSEEAELTIVDLVFFDWYLWLRLGQSKVAFLNDVVGCYRYHVSNQTKQQTPGNLNNYLGLRKVLVLSFNNGILNSKQLIKGIDNLTLKYSINYFREFINSETNLTNSIRNGINFCINYGFNKKILVVKFLLTTIKVLIVRSMRVMKSQITS